MPTYDGTYKLAVEDGRVLIRDVEGGSQSTHVPLEIYSNYAAQGTLTDSRQLRLRTQPYLESNTANAYVTDMGIESGQTDNYFFITAPQKTSNVGSRSTFVISKTSNVGIGVTDPTKPLHVVGDSFITGTLSTNYISIDTATSSNLSISSNLEVGSSNLFVNTATGNVGIGIINPEYALHVVGNIYATGDITALSDKRHKEDLLVIDSALDKVKRLTGYTYTLHGNRSAGLLAQDVLEVLPEVVKGSEDTNYSLAYGNLMGLTIEAIKELDKKVDRILEKHGSS